MRRKPKYELPPDPDRMLEIAHRIRLGLASVDVGKSRRGTKTLLDCTDAAGLAYDMERLLPLLKSAPELLAALTELVEPVERWRNDPDYGSSGYAVTPEDCTQSEEAVAWNAAADNWAQNGGGV
jgi:hypothetical protein